MREGARSTEDGAAPLNDPRHDFTALDWIGAVIAGHAALGLLAFPIAGQRFASMFRDFGSRDLPTLTWLAISWWFPLALGSPVICSMALGLRRGSPIQHRRAWIVAAFLLSCFGLALCLVGAYLPIFSLAGSIKAD